MTETDDDKIWTAYAKGVKPLAKVKASKKPVPANKKQPRASTAKIIPPKTITAPAVKPAILFDKRAERRLRQGDVEIDARIDLHGFRQDEAYQALSEFIGRHIRANRRALLIITGKGRDGAGVLRANLAKWLSSSIYADRILALRTAAPRHGGTGAFYLLLKKEKTQRE